MSVPLSFLPGKRPAHLRLAAGILLVLAVAACNKQQEATPAPGAGAGAAADTAKPAEKPAQAVSSEVAALSTEELRKKATQAYQDSRLYAPAGDNAMEYYLALRDKAPGDPGVSSALTDLLPMTVIATEQSRDRGDFGEARRLYGLLEKADKDHPALPRLKTSIAAAEETAAKRAEQQQLTAEQDKARKEQLEKERLAQQQLQQQQAAQQLAAQQLAAQQAEQAAAAQRAADQKAAAERAERDRLAKEAAAKKAAAAPVASELRPISTPPPKYPIEALRANQSGEVQVEFTVGADGSVTSARVVRSNPPRVFDREAVAAVKRWRFEPTGAAVTTRRTIGFNPGQ